MLINRTVKARVLNQKESGYFAVYYGLSLHILFPNKVLLPPMKQLKFSAGSSLPRVTSPTS